MFNKQISINLMTNILALVLLMVFNFWSTPLLILHLGMSAFGYIGIISNMLAIFAVAGFTLNSMVGPFYTVALNKGDKNAANECINSAIFACIGFIAMFLPIGFYITINIKEFLIINEGYLFDFQCAFLLSIFVYFLSMFGAVMSTGTYATNRLEISNSIKIIGVTSKFIVLFCLFIFFVPHIWFISCAALVDVVICILLGYMSFKYVVPDVTFNLRLVTVKQVRELIVAGFFNSIIMLGTVLMTQISLLVANRYVAADAVGILATFFLVMNSLTSISAAVSSTFSPTTLEVFSKGNTNHGLLKYLKRILRICGFTTGWILVVFATVNDKFFYLWLGKDLSDYYWFVALLMLLLISNLAVAQLNVIHQAANRLQLPAIASIVCGMFNFLLAVVLCKYFNSGLWGICFSVIFTTTMRFSFFAPIYTALLLDEKWHVFYKDLLRIQTIGIIVFCVGAYINYAIVGNGVLNFLLVCFIVSVLYWFVVLMYLSSEEKAELLSIVNKIKARITC